MNPESYYIEKQGEMRELDKNIILELRPELLQQNFDKIDRFVDKQYLQVIPTENYTNIFDFSEGLALVEQDHQYGFINHVGQQVIPCQYEKARSFPRD